MSSYSILKESISKNATKYLYKILGINGIVETFKSLW